MYLLISSVCQIKKELWVFPDEFKKRLYLEASVFSPNKAFQMLLNHQYEKEEIMMRTDGGVVSHPFTEQTI